MHKDYQIQIKKIYFLFYFYFFFLALNTRHFSVKINHVEENCTTRLCSCQVNIVPAGLPMTQFDFSLFSGVPGVKPERFEEGMKIRHCALSLVG